MKIKILIVEHDPIDIELIQHELRKAKVNYVAQFAQTEKEYENSLRNFAPDIILSDYTFPMFDGLLAFKIKEEMAPDIPFIFVTGTIGEENSIALIKSGVTDYVLKDNLLPLASKINRGLKEAKEKSEGSNAQLRNNFKAQLLNNIGQAVMATDLNGIIQFWNKAAEQIFGWTAAETIGNHVLQFIPSQHTKEEASAIIEELYKGNSWSGEMEMQRKDGSSFTVMLTDSPVYDEKQQLSGIIGIATDITDRKKAEEKINKANRLYAFLSQINQNIVHVSDDAALFHNSCSIAIEHGKFKMAWIGMFDQENTTINLVHQKGIPHDELSNFRNAPYQSNGPQDYVLRTGKHYICNDIVNDLELESWKPFAAKHGLQSCIVLPIKKSGVIIGTFNLYSANLYFSDSEEIALLVEVTNDISFALENFEKAKKHKETEELVVQNEKRFRTIIEKGLDMITLRSPEGKLIYVSPSITTVLGHSAHELLRANAFDFIHPEDLPGLLEQTQIILKVPGSSFFNQRRYLHKNGNWVWCEGWVTNLIYEPGIHALVSNFRDISEKKIAEIELLATNERLSFHIENTPLGFIEWDSELKVTSWSRQAEEIFGWTEKEIIEKEKTGLFKIAKQLIADQIVRNKTQHKNYTKEGKVIWCEWFNSVMKDKSGKVITVMSLVQDITERKKGEESLMQSESRLKESQAIAHICNWEIDLVNNVHSFSDEFYKIYGIIKEEVEPSIDLFLSLMHPDDRNLAQKKVYKAFNKLRPSSLNFRFIRKDGDMRYGYTEWRFEFDKNNIATRVFGILRDETERKLSELKLEEQNIELLKTNKELDRFLYSVSHDLRSPLTSMLGVITFIEDESLEADTLEHAKMIRKSIHRLDGFIKNILNYSQNKRSDLEVEQISLQKTTEEIVAALGSMKEARGIQFEINIDEQQPFYSDGQRFNTIMENLIANAIKYHKKDVMGRYIKVTGTSNNEKLQFRIDDNGIGIAPANHAKIFDMFFRLSSKTDGSGIGLYIVKETLDRLEGSIEVQSEEGTGTSFDITLKNLTT